MDRGYVKFYRKSVESRVFQNDGLWRVWSWCLFKANHKKCWVTVNTGRGETEIEVGPGQFIFGRKTASKELKMPESSIRNRIAKLKNMQNLTVKPDTHYSIITIINWGIYQDTAVKEDRQEDNQRTGKGQAKDTDKNDKNVKNDKKKHMECVFLTDEEHKKLKIKFNANTENWIQRLNDYKMSTGKKYKSDYHTILNWERKGNQQRESDPDELSYHQPIRSS